MSFSKKAQKKIDEMDNRIKELEDEIQDLTIKYKYGLFDVEACQREIKYYRKILLGD